jgi:hypothetical protein
VLFSSFDVGGFLYTFGVPALALGWFVWPVVLLQMKVRGWRLFVPLAFGLLTAGGTSLLRLLMEAASRQI